MARLLFIGVVLILLTSCATKMVMQEIEGGNRLVINEYVSNVKRAVASLEEKIFVCLEITDIREKSKRLVTMIVPIDRQRDTDINKNDGSRFVKVSLKDEPVADCAFEGKELPIVFIQNKYKLSKLSKQFDFGKNSAIYALEGGYQDAGKFIANIGYFKLKPNGYDYEFRQFLYNHEIYESKVVEGNPWMYGILPLAVIADVFMVVASQGQYLWEEPENQTKLWKKNMPNQPIQLDEHKLIDWEEE